MTATEFQAQIDRLIQRFEAKSFDAEFIKLAWAAVSKMSAESFKTFVDVMIGSRPHNRAPLIPDFREAAQAEANRAVSASWRETPTGRQTDDLSPDERRAKLRLIKEMVKSSIKTVGD